MNLAAAIWLAAAAVFAPCLPADCRLTDDVSPAETALAVVCYRLAAHPDDPSLQLAYGSATGQLHGEG